MSQSFGVGEIIHCHKLHIFTVISGPINKPTDSSEAVNGYFDCHIHLPNEEKLFIKRYFLSTCFAGFTTRDAADINTFLLIKQRHTV